MMSIQLGIVIRASSHQFYYQSIINYFGKIPLGGIRFTINI